eukprot:283396-Chlamydomonas_euryale.AAC.10
MKPTPPSPSASTFHHHLHPFHHPTTHPLWKDAVELAPPPHVELHAERRRCHRLCVTQAVLQRPRRRRAGRGAVRHERRDNRAEQHEQRNQGARAGHRCLLQCRKNVCGRKGEARRRELGACSKEVGALEGKAGRGASHQDIDSALIRRPVSQNVTPASSGIGSPIPGLPVPRPTFQGHSPEGNRISL